MRPSPLPRCDPASRRTWRRALASSARSSRRRQTRAARPLRCRGRGGPRQTRDHGGGHPRSRPKASSAAPPDRDDRSKGIGVGRNVRDAGPIARRRRPLRVAGVSARAPAVHARPGDGPTRGGVLQGNSSLTQRRRSNDVCGTGQVRPGQCGQTFEKARGSPGPIEKRRRPTCCRETRALDCVPTGSALSIGEYPASHRAAA